MTMKPPEQWLKELVTVRFMLCADVAAIQADARADLKQAILEHCVEMDAVMKGPASYQRGCTIARLVSKLQETAKL